MNKNKFIIFYSIKAFTVRTHPSKKIKQNPMIVGTGGGREGNLSVPFKLHNIFFIRVKQNQLEINKARY